MCWRKPYVTSSEYLYSLTLTSSDTWRQSVAQKELIKPLFIYIFIHIPCQLSKRAGVLLAQWYQGTRYPIKRLILRSRSLEIYVKNCPIALKFDWCINSTASEAPTKFQSDTTILISNLVVSRFSETLRILSWAPVSHVPLGAAAWLGAGYQVINLALNIHVASNRGIAVYWLTSPTHFELKIFDNIFNFH